MIRKYTQASVRKISEDVETTRYIEFIASDNSRDSYKTVLPVNKWALDRYAANPVIGYQHMLYSSTNPDMVIGSGKAFIEGDLLIIGITFEPFELNPLADKIFRKILHGTIRAVSVGFDPIGVGSWGQGDEAYGKPNQTYYYAGQELIEVSVVHIPANKNAIIRMLENKKGLKGLKDLSEDAIITVESVLRMLEEGIIDTKDTEKETSETSSEEKKEIESKETIDEKVRQIEQEITIAEAEALSFQIK